MSNVKIRIAATEEELDIVQDMATYAFSPSPVGERDRSHRPYTKESKKYILYENDIPVSILDSIPMTQNVRGKIYTMQGIAGVATYPEGRRKGFAKKLMKLALSDAKKDNMVMSTLYPFREKFYGKFGYVPFPHEKEAVISPENMRDVASVETKGNIERVIGKEAIDRLYAFLKRVQSKIHGMGLFTELITKRMEKLDFWLAFSVVDGVDTGMMTFTTRGFEGEFLVNKFLYKDSNAKYLLLQHIYSHLDQFKSVKLRILPNEKPETWIYDMKLKVKNRAWVPSSMGRILDISQIGGMIVGEGSINIELMDYDCEWNNGKWKLYSENGKLVVEETDTADFTMNINGLSAIIFGGYDIDDINFRNWASMNEDHKMTVMKLFPSAIPSLFEMF